MRHDAHTSTRDPRPPGTGREPGDGDHRRRIGWRFRAGKPPTERTANRWREVLTLIVTLFFVATAWSEKPPPTPPKDVETEKLGDRLVRRAASQTDEDIMAAILRLMDEAASKLEIEFDAGEETQALQTSILERLDEAIRMAASQRRASRRGRSDWTGEKRKMPSRSNGENPRKSEDQAQGDRSRNAGAGAGQRQPQEVEPLGGDMRELRRAWGLLPQREREQILQGSSEAFLERYREWIERYYRALQVAEE